MNCGMGFEGPIHRANYADVDDRPVGWVVLTQGHYDHVGGVDRFLDDDPEVIAQESFTIWRDDNERLEAFRSRNAAFAWIDAIMAAVTYAQEHVDGDLPAQSRPEPTRTFSDRLELDAGGRRIELIATPGGETTDALVAWLPESRTLLSGNVFGPLFGHVPNLVTMRGDRYRDALAYVDAVQTVIDLRPERLLTGHFDPIDGADLIEAELTRMRDATQYVHDRTVEGMNAGVDVHTLMRDIRLPSNLDVGEGYGTVRWNVRAIWETYAGWFHHRSTTELYGVPPSAVAADLVRLAGAPSLVEAAARHVAADRPVEALHLTDLLLDADPDDLAARRVATEAHTALLARTGNFWEAAWLRRAIARLEGTA